jgi:hypothetical protein
LKISNVVNLENKRLLEDKGFKPLVRLALEDKGLKPLVRAIELPWR